MPLYYPPCHSPHFGPQTRLSLSIERVWPEELVSCFLGHYSRGNPLEPRIIFPKLISQERTFNGILMVLVRGTNLPHARLFYELLRKNPPFEFPNPGTRRFPIFCQCYPEARPTYARPLGDETKTSQGPDVPSSGESVPYPAAPSVLRSSNLVLRAKTKSINSADCQ